jgi:hypothetical protein
MKTYKDYMRAMLPKAEQKTHDRYKFSLEELDTNDNLGVEDKAEVRRFLHGIKLQPHPPTCPPPLSCTTAIGAGPPSGTKRHHQTPDEKDSSPPKVQRIRCIISKKEGRPSGPRLQPSRGLSPE